MRNFQDTFETRKRSLISNFSMCMIAPLIRKRTLVQPTEHFFNILRPNQCLSNKGVKYAINSLRIALFGFLKVKREKIWSRVCFESPNC